MITAPTQDPTPTPDPSPTLDPTPTRDPETIDPVDPTARVTCTSDPVLPCWTEDPDLWFAESPQSVEDAKALCVPCPLREACLAGALERREPWGVWGGQLVVAGVVVPRKRPRGRPRKVEVAA